MPTYSGSAFMLLHVSEWNLYSRCAMSAKCQSCDARSRCLQWDEKALWKHLVWGTISIKYPLEIQSLWSRTCIDCIQFQNHLTTTHNNKYIQQQVYKDTCNVYTDKMTMIGQILWLSMRHNTCRLKYRLTWLLTEVRRISLHSSAELVQLVEWKYDIGH